MLGYSLNQKGLFAGVVRDPRNRTVKTNTDIGSCSIHLSVFFSNVDRREYRGVRDRGGNLLYVGRAVPATA